MARMPLPTSPQTSQREGKGDWVCIVCHQPMVTKPNTVWVWVVEGGAQIATPDETEPTPSDVGLHPVGPSCTKLIPREFRHKLPEMG